VPLCVCSPKAPGEGPPTVLMGAEGAGVVAAVGPGVTKLKVKPFLRTVSCRGRTRQNGVMLSVCGLRQNGVWIKTEQLR